MTEKKPRTPKTQYEITDAKLLATIFPDLVIPKFNKSELYKKVKAAAELNVIIPGIQIAGQQQTPVVPAETPTEPQPSTAEPISTPAPAPTPTPESDPYVAMPDHMKPKELPL